MDEIEQRKLQVEIANLEAETKRALSESAKAEAETRAVGKSGWDWTAPEWIRNRSSNRCH